MNCLEDYDALAKTITKYEITKGVQNRRIMHSLMTDDPTFKSLSMFFWSDDDDNYDPMNGYDLVWLGYFVGRNCQLDKLCIHDYIRMIEERAGVERDRVNLFVEGLNRNKSIKSLDLDYVGHGGGIRVNDLELLFRNTKLVDLRMSDCVLDRGAISILPSAQTLQTVAFDNIPMDVETLSESLQALWLLPELQNLAFTVADISVDECKEIVDFLRRDPPKLISLDLSFNSIDDDAIEVLVPVILSHTNLQGLDLSCNTGLSMRGLRVLSALLKSKNCSLKRLGLESINMNDEGAQLFVDALANNKTLVQLSLDDNDISATGWAAFSRLLCDASSINNIYSSNHTLNSLGKHSNQVARASNAEAGLLLCINEQCESVQQAVALKVLQYHPHLDMKPLFEWDFKVLPFVIDWFFNALDHISSYCFGKKDYSHFNAVGFTALAEIWHEDMLNRKLSSLYQFVRSVPELYIESHLLVDLMKIRSKKMRLLRKLSRLQQGLEAVTLSEQEVVGALKSRRIHFE